MYVMSQEQGERMAKKTKTMIGAATNLTATQEWQRLPRMRELVENRNHVLFRDEAAWAGGKPHYERPSNTQKCLSVNWDSHPLSSLFVHTNVDLINNACTCSSQPPLTIVNRGTSNNPIVNVHGMVTIGVEVST